MKRSIARNEELAESIAHVGKRLQQSSDTLTEEERIFLELRRKYPTDVGLFSVFLLNLIHLEKGQGVFIGAGIPHAYLRGNVVECMATSDNVVRAGLTPKYKDIETMVEILNYDAKPALILGESPDIPEVLYQTPAAEFQVRRCKMQSNEERHRVTGSGLEVFLVTEGKIIISWRNRSESNEEEFHRGQSILIPAFLEEFKLLSKGRAELFEVTVPLD
jgi:mannose-6-phosphate isomerase